jgi:hypothetical protein
MIRPLVDGTYIRTSLGIVGLASGRPAGAFDLLEAAPAVTREAEEEWN